MDYSKFSDEDFDSKTWINAAFKIHKEGTLEQYATNLVMKLQMFMQEVSNVLEDNCQQVVSNLPRATKELEALGQEVSMLHEQMKMVKYDIQKVEHETANSMQTLLKLDVVKGRIKLASDALREADNWTTLSSDVEEVFGSQDIDAVAKKIVGMQQSLHILTDVPDYADRCQYLEMLKNRLEATSSTSIVSAFSSQSLESAQKFAKIFLDIERLPQLCKYYHKCHKSKLQEFWKDLQSGLHNTEEGVKEMLDSFYDHLLMFWQTQVKWCEQVFPDPVSIVCDLLSDSLNNLSPSPHSVINACVKSSSNPAEMLISLKSKTDEFVAFLDKTMSVHLGSCKSMSLKQLLIAVYSPYKPFINKFPKQEQVTLQAFLDRVKLDHEEFMESTTLLEKSVSSIFRATSESLKRCVQFTNGVSFIPYIEVLKDYIKAYLKEVRRVVTNIFEKCAADPISLDNDEWPHYQNSLRVVQMCGDLILHLDELDQSLISHIINSFSKHRLPHKSSDEGSDSFESKRLAYLDSALYFLDSKEEQKELEDLVTALEAGDIISILDLVKQEAYDLCALIHKYSFDIVFNPLKHYLQIVPNLQVWKSENVGNALTSNLPNFSLVPQEYITNVGQYLMTLPQQLEPFTGENILTMQVALKFGHLPFTTSSGELPEHMAEMWLESLARGSLHNYCEQILLIPELTPTSTKQLLIDIGYITNVLDDLGLKPTESIKDICSLLESKEEDYFEIAEDCPQRLSSAIAYMRGFLKK